RLDQAAQRDRLRAGRRRPGAQPGRAARVGARAGRPRAADALPRLERRPRRAEPLGQRPRAGQHGTAARLLLAPYPRRAGAAPPGLATLGPFLRAATNQLSDPASLLTAFRQFTGSEHCFYVDPHHTSRLNPGFFPRPAPGAAIALLIRATGPYYWRGDLPPSA